MFKRVTLLVLTNLAIMAVLGVVMFGLSAAGAFGPEGLNSMDYLPALLMAAVFGFGGALLSLFMSKSMAKRATGARVIESPRNDSERWILETVHRQAAALGIQPPEVGIYDSPAPNAFATGARRDASLVAVSTGLLNSMTREEAEAVLAHELSHVANGDMITLTLLQGVLNTFVIFLARMIGSVVDRMIFRSRNGYGPGYLIITMVMQTVLGIGATLIVMAFSRHREYRADEGGAKLEGAPSMANALRALGRFKAPAELPDQLEAFGIKDGNRTGMMRFFQSHPPLEARIARLEASAQQVRSRRPVAA